MKSLFAQLFDSPALDSLALDSLALDSLALDSLALDSLALDSPALDPVRRMHPDCGQQNLSEVGSEVPQSGWALDRISASAVAAVAAVAGLPDETLLNQLDSLVKHDRALTVGLLLHLGEVDLRRLHCAKACPSLFAYCTSRLGFAEDVAYKRIGAARLVRRFPAALELLARGEINVTTLMLVGPHLTEQNHIDCLAAISRKTKREVECIVAARCPKPDVPTSMRRLPEPRAQPRRSAVPASQANPLKSNEPKAQSLDVNGKVSREPVAESNDAGFAADPRAVLQRPVARIAPLSAHRYRVTFTASECLKVKLERAQELVSHVVRSGDIVALIERAIDQLIQHEEQRRFAISARHRRHGRAAGSEQDLDPDPAETPEAAPRYVPAPLRRAIWQRDGGQCTFVDEAGNRCPERRFLEIEHRQPHAHGGPTSLDNCCLLCKSHNAYRAEQAFGREFIAKRRAHGSGSTAQHGLR